MSAKDGGRPYSATVEASFVAQGTVPEQAAPSGFLKTTGKQPALGEGRGDTAFRVPPLSHVAPLGTDGGYLLSHKPRPRVEVIR